MIIWINGAFGAGKTTTSALLLERIPDAHLFDPEDLGYVVQKTFPAARTMDYQDLALWRRLTLQFIVDAKRQFTVPLIIPMTLVVPTYLDEIFSGIHAHNLPLIHFFLHTEKGELHRRIENQVIISSDQTKDEEVRQWRLAQIERCMAAEQQMPGGTIHLDTNIQSPEQVVEWMLQSIKG